MMDRGHPFYILTAWYLYTEEGKGNNTTKGNLTVFGTNLRHQSLDTTCHCKQS